MKITVLQLHFKKQLHQSYSIEIISKMPERLETCQGLSNNFNNFGLKLGGMKNCFEICKIMNFSPLVMNLRENVFQVAFLLLIFFVDT